MNAHKETLTYTYSNTEALSYRRKHTHNATVSESIDTALEGNGRQLMGE